MLTINQIKRLLRWNTQQLRLETRIDRRLELELHRNILKDELINALEEVVHNARIKLR